MQFKELFKRGALWAGLSLPLNLVWEIAQLPLYAIPPNNSDQVAYGILHCTIGDGLIAGVAFIVTGFALHAEDWPAQRLIAGTALITLVGMAYTIFSEWYNVNVLASWQYATTMPRLYGIGVSPLLQWLIVPAVTLLIWRALAKGRVTSRVRDT